MRTTSQSGSHIVALGFGLLVVAAIAFAGYRVWTMQQPATGSTTADTVPAKITNTSDLKQAAAVLDNSASQLNSGLNDSDLNSDLSDLL